MEELKYKYTTEIKQYPNTTEKFIAVKMNEDKSALNGFLNVEITSAQTSQIYLEKINNVLEKKSEFESVYGDIFGIEVKFDKTDIMNAIVENGKVDTIETAELKKLINAWVKEKEKFENQKKKEVDSGRDFF